MMINYWNCKFSNVELRNIGVEDESDIEWEYGCDCPANKSKICSFDNKWAGDEDD
jgi:hypothetical protein